jgi:hypothetical protein
LYARSRLALQDFFKNYGEIATVAIPSIPPRSFTRLVAKPVTEFFVFEETPNHRRELSRVHGIVENHTIHIVRDYF